MIEKNIHQIWIGPYRMPKRCKDNSDKIKSLHPNFEYYLWTNDNLPTLPAGIKGVFDTAWHPAIQCDVLRLFIMYEYGGLYIDMDFILQDANQGANNLDFDNYDAILTNHRGPLETFANTAMACRKHHPLWGFILEDIVREWTMSHWIGPQYLGKVVKKYFNADDNITHEEFEEKFLLPNKIKGIEFYNDFCVNNFFHHAMATWMKGSEWNLKLINGDYE